MKYLQIAIISVLLVLLAAFTLMHAKLGGWMTPKISPLQAAKIIEPHLRIFKPAGAGPFPTILMLHGCGGDEEQQVYWGKTFQEWGFAAVYVDSYTGRGIDFERAISHVCAGRELIGGERAGDLLTALAWARRQPWADFDALTVIGWSHGGWSVMDAFAMHAAGNLPHGLNAHPAADLADIDKLVLFYPYCGLGDQGSEQGWKHTPATLIITVEHDTVVGDKVCDRSFAAIERKAAHFRHEVFSGVDHAFDTDAVTTQTGWQYRTPKPAGQAATKKARQLLRQFLESL